MNTQSLRFEVLVAFLILVTFAPAAYATPAVSVNFTLSQVSSTVYVTAWAQGQLPATVTFSITISYSDQGTHGFVNIYSSSVTVRSANGYASTTVQANGGTASTGHYFVSVQVYDSSTGQLLGFAAYDPGCGGSNGGPGDD